MADFNSIEDYFNALQNDDALIGDEVDSEGCERCDKPFKATIKENRTYVCPHCGQEYTVE